MKSFYKIVLLVLLHTVSKTDGKGTEPPTPPANESHCAASTGNHFVVVGPPGRDGRDGPPGPPGVDIQELRDLIHILTKEEMRNQSHHGNKECPSQNGTLLIEMLQELREITKALSATAQTQTQQNVNLVVKYDAICPNHTAPPPTTTATTTSLPTTAVVNSTLRTPSLPTLITPRSGNSKCIKGRSADTPADSCFEILKCDYFSKSGYYWIKVKHPTELNKVTPLLLFCSMDYSACNLRGAMRVAYLDTSQNHSCPSVLGETVQSGKKLCTVKSTGVACDSVQFPTYGIRHQRVCGQAKGYAYHWGPAFHYNTRTLNDAYTTGLSITSGPQNDRTHVWTYASGNRDISSGGSWNCPCASGPGNNPPLFIGHDYLCESGTHTSNSVKWYMENPLWDGQGCYTGSSCCSTSRMPWFWTDLPDVTDEDLEVRWCRGYADSNNIGIEHLELYIR